MAPCLVSDKGLLGLKDFYSNIEKYINRNSLYRDKIWVIGQKVLLLMPMELVKY